MKFSQEFIERVSSANNIVDIISQHTQLKPAGGGLMGRCPFPDHPEKTPSFSVSEVKQVYHCFGCHKSGNIFKFLETFNGMSFPEAVEFLAHRANISMPVVDKEASDKLDKLVAKKRQIIEANKLAVQYFREQFTSLPESHPAKQYATKRGLTAEVVSVFKIGYAPAEWDGLYQYLLKKGISSLIAEEAKLVKQKSGGGHYDLFRERIMFPIFDSKNEPIAFGGRILGSGDYKYLNSPETLVFSKSKTLYGLSETAKFIRSEDQVIVVEGYMDLISLYKAGIKNVVAPMGTALTAEQSKILRRHSQNIVVLFDGDEAGQNAAEKSLPTLLEADLHPKGLVLSEQLDPDEFLAQYGGETLKQIIQAAPELFSTILEKWLSDYRGEASQKIRLADQLKQVITVVADSRLRTLLIEEAALKMSVDARWLTQAILQNPAQVKTEKAVSVDASKSQAKPVEVVNNLQIKEDFIEGEKIKLSGATQAEYLLMALALKSRSNFSQYLSSNVFASILHPGVKKVLERAALVCGQDIEKFDRLVSLLTTYVDLPEKLLAPNFLDNEGDETKLLQDCIIKVRERHYKYQAHIIAQELKGQGAQQGLDPAKLEQIMNIQRNRLALRKGKDVSGDNNEALKRSPEKEEKSELE